MSPSDVDESLRETLRKLKEYGGLKPLSEVVGVNVRTLYRHAGKNPPDMRGDTRGPLLAMFGRLGLVGGYEDLEVAQAIEEMREIKKRSQEAADHGQDAVADVPSGSASGDEPKSTAR